MEKNIACTINKITNIMHLHREILQKHADTWNDFEEIMNMLELGISTNTHIIDFYSDVESSLEKCIVCSELKSMEEDLLCCVKEVFLQTLKIKEAIKHNNDEKLLNNNKYDGKIYIKLLSYVDATEKNLEHVCFFLNQCWMSYEDTFEYIHRKLYSILELDISESHLMNDIVKKALNKFNNIPNVSINNYKIVRKNIVTARKKLRCTIHLMKHIEYNKN